MPDPENLSQDPPGLQYYAYPYGINSYTPLPQWRIHLSAFLDAPYEGSLSKYEHCQKAIKLLWPEVGEPQSWNPWLERVLQACCTEEYAIRRHGTTVRTIVLSGCAAAGKTFSAGLFTCIWWLAAPDRSIAYFTSTSRSMIRRRIWPVIQRFARGGVGNQKTGQRIEFGGNMVDSKTTLQASKGDDKHSIAALAVAQGEVNEAVAKLSGQHADRILLVIDEGQATPEAIYATIPNMRKGCKDLTIIVIENPCGKLTGSGRVSEPENGWSSVGVNTQEWRTKGVPEWQVEPGLCVRFDGAQSPNVQVGEDRWPFIYTRSDWEAAQDPNRLGTLSYWVQDRGLQPPDGTANTIFTENLVIRCDGYGQFTFLSRKWMIAFLDPAFGGDACVLRIAEVGDTDESKEGLQLLDTIEIPIDPESPVDIEKQIAMTVIGHCKRFGVRPENFGTDATGIGRGVAYAMAEEWSPLIRRIEFGGAASEMPASTDDPRQGREVYFNRVTELWYSVREFLMAEQIKGLTPQDVREFCTREYEHKNKKYRIQKKDEMKAVLGYSPDHADAVAGVVEIARQNGFALQSRLQRRAEAESDRVAREHAQESAYDADEVAEGGWAESDIYEENEEEEAY